MIKIEYNRSHKISGHPPPHPQSDTYLLNVPLESHLPFEEGRRCISQKVVSRAFLVVFENKAPKTPFRAIFDVFEAHIWHFSWHLQGTFGNFEGKFMQGLHEGRGSSLISLPLDAPLTYLFCSNVLFLLNCIYNWSFIEYLLMNFNELSAKCSMLTMINNNNNNNSKILKCVLKFWSGY